MNSTDFTRIDETLQVRLPEWYRSTLSFYPFPNEELELFASADEVIRQNQTYRKSGWFNCPWPASFLIIGEDGCGNLFFVNLAADERRIFIADHDGGPPPEKEMLDEMVFSDTPEDDIGETVEVKVGEESVKRAVSFHADLVDAEPIIRK